MFPQLFYFQPAMNIENLHRLFLLSSGASTDTRNISAGNIFFALKGENFNANEFAQSALKQGAGYAVIDEAGFAISEKLILVDDVLITLQQLANYHRRKFQIPVLAITGSNGKTTTKELIYHVLKSPFNTIATEGNLNNHIGVPLTLLRINQQTEIAVIEMGANHQNEIAALCEIAEPTHGLITNIGKAHLEGFGGLEGVKKAKSELYRWIEKNKGIAFVNADDETLKSLLGGIADIIRYGNEVENFVSGEIISANSFLELEVVWSGEKIRIQSQLIGSYNFENILCAACVGIYFKVPIDKIKKAIENYISTNNRSQILKHDTNSFVMDAYNANPSSMKAALENFQNLNAEIKIVILGDMFELGEESACEHQSIVDQLSKMNFTKVILVGKEFGKTHSTNELIQFNSMDNLKVWFNQQKFSNTTFLVKGSRKMGLEKILE